jgi:hypothetical protein
MNRPLDPAIQPGNPTRKQKTGAPFPGWEQLPAECQRELVTTLAMMLIKRLPERHGVPKEVNCEQAC